MGRSSSRLSHCPEMDGKARLERPATLSQENSHKISFKHSSRRESMLYCETSDFRPQTTDRSCIVHRASNIILLASCLLLLLLTPTISFAQDQPAELGEIRVDAESEAEAKDAPSSFVTIITPEQENVQFDTVSELISSSVGVTSQSLGGMGQFSTVSIRGSSPEQVSVYLDGVKLNTASGGAFDFSTIPIDSIARIEVIRGGGTTQFGADAIGGVINIVTKKAVEGRFIEAFGGGGSFTTVKLGASYRERFKKNAFTLAWTNLLSKGDYTFKTNSVRLSGAPTATAGRTYTRIHNSFISESLLASWEHSFTDQIKLNVLNDFFFTDRDVPGTEEETTILYPTNPLNAHEKIFRDTSSVTINVDPFFIKPVNFQWGVTNNFDIDLFKDPTPAIGNPIDVRTNNYALTSFLKWMAILDHGFMNQAITFRYDYEFDYLTDSSPISTTRLTGTRDRHINSVFAQDEIAFWKDKIIILPAVRYQDSSDFSDDVTFKGGLKINPLSWLTLKSNFEKSFRYPSFGELYYPDQGYIRGNPNLKKEEAYNLDAGIVLTTKYAGFEAAYFRNWVDNSILFVPISATTIAPVNTFKVDIYGAEFQATFTPVKYVYLGVNYTYLSAHYASNNNQLPGRPKHEFNSRLELNYDVTKKFGGTIFSNFNYKNSVPLNTANTVFLSPRSKIDLGLNLRFLKNYYLTFEAKNITNVQIYDARGFPLPRRSFFATLGAKWS